MSDVGELRTETGRAVEPRLVDADPQQAEVDVELALRREQQDVHRVAVGERIEVGRDQACRNENVSGPVTMTKPRSERSTQAPRSRSAIEVGAAASRRRPASPAARARGPRLLR